MTSRPEQIEMLVPKEEPSAQTLPGPGRASPLDACRWGQACRPAPPWMGKRKPRNFTLAQGQPCLVDLGEEMPIQPPCLQMTRNCYGR